MKGSNMAKGQEIGIVVMPNKNIDSEQVVSPLKQVVRIMTEEDEHRLEQNRQKEKTAYQVCEQKIAQRGLKMNLVDVSCTFDNSKLLFYFTADNRSWSKIWHRYSGCALSCGRSGYGTRRKCSEDLVSADGNFAVGSIWLTSSLFLSRWQRSRGCL